MLDQFAGTRAEREWLATFRRIAEALERVATRMEGQDGDDEQGGSG